MTRLRIHRGGFSLVELITVVGVLALLIGILVPVVSTARRQARATRCIANLQQWGQAFQMYASAYNHSFAMHSAPDATELLWWEVLAEFNSDIRGSLLCPEAIDARDESRGPGDGVQLNYPPGSASYAWRARTYSVAAPVWTVRGDWRGSYGLNYWVLRPNTKFQASELVRFPPKDSASIPFLGDCTVPTDYPNSSNHPPRNLTEPEAKNTLPFCIDRHRMAVNMAFLDGHVERVGLAELFKLKWSESYVPRDVVVPAP